MPNQIALGEIAPGCAKVDPILVADNVTRQFGGLTAVDVAHVEIPRGQITALIGPNGAGKTTFFNLLTGFDKPNTGTWIFDGKNLAGVASYKVARMGMVRTFQLTKALSLLTVMENMRLGYQNQTGENPLAAMFRWVWRKQENQVTEIASELLTRFKLGDKSEDFAASLSGGQRKRVALAAMMVAEADLILLDEPTAGMSKSETSRFIQLIKEVTVGKTLLTVEHDMGVVFGLADKIAVVVYGEVIAYDTPEAVRSNHRVQEAYLGAALEAEH